LRKLFFQKKVFSHGEKENFEEYSLFLESAEFSFAILINYSAEKNQPAPGYGTPGEPNTCPTN
jgi:hypothetical protein